MSLTPHQPIFKKEDASSNSGTRKLTKVTADTLLHMFQPEKFPDKRIKRTNDTASQSTMSGTQFKLCELIFEQHPTQVITANHARDKMYLNRSLEQQMISIVLEESYQRSRIFIAHRDGLDMVWRVFSSTAPRKGFVRRMMAPRPGSGLDTPDSLLLEDTPLGVLEDLPSMAPTGGTSPNIEQENNTLRERLQVLHNILMQKRQMVATEGGSASVMGGDAIKTRFSSQNNYKELKGKLRVLLLQCEEAQRALISEAESSEFKQVLEQVERMILANLVYSARRVLVVTPYEGYRPKVPAEHQFKGEEYLKRWLMAETFQHYNDLFYYFQAWENECRVSIWEEEELTWQPLFTCFMSPYYIQKCQELEASNAQMKNDMAEMKRHMDHAGALAKEHSIVEAEEYGRLLIEQLQVENYTAMHVVVAQLDGIRNLDRRVEDLHQQLRRQNVRHRRETQALKAQLPMDGIRVHISEFAPHGELELPSTVLRNATSLEYDAGF